MWIFLSLRAPQHITRARIDESVEEIEGRAFFECENLVHVETHNRIRKIGEFAFFGCKSLPRIAIKSVVEICGAGFYECKKLQFVEFGDKLETIGNRAFFGCPIEHLKLPSVVLIDGHAFGNCRRLIDVEFSDKLERISSLAFIRCWCLQRIAIPLKRGFLSFDDLFYSCDQLTRVDLVGGVHQTAASLHMESWRTEMVSEINSINQLLPDTDSWMQTRAIKDWMDSVMNKMEHYKAEHYIYLKEAATLLELALWKAKLAEREDSCEESEPKKVKIDADDARKESRVTCGADTVIKNVLPFLQLK